MCHLSRESVTSIMQGPSFVLISVYYSSATEMRFTTVIVGLHLFTIVPQAVSVIQSLTPASLVNHATFGLPLCAMAEGRP